jgi:hypothetical protein
MLGFKSLKYPVSPDPAAPDYYAQCRRYWEESRVWWDNWAGNFIRCLVLLLVVAAAVTLVILVPWLRVL